MDYWFDVGAWFGLVSVIELEEVGLDQLLYALPGGLDSEPRDGELRRVQPHVHELSQAGQLQATWRCQLVFSLSGELESEAS